MKREIQFYLYSLIKTLENNSKNRVSFIITIIGMIINNIFFIVIWILFINSVGVINGWNIWYIIGSQGLLSISYGIVHSVCGGVLDVPRSVYKGSFDKYLISPKNIIMRILPSHIDTSAIGDVIYGTICLVGFVIMLDLNLLQIIVLILSLIFSIVLFLGLSIFISSISFFINDSLTVSRTLIDLVMTPAIQNGGMIQGKMRFLFTFIIPSLIISIIPIEVIISLDIYKLFMIFIISIIWFILSIYWFKYAVKRYNSNSTIGAI